MFEVEMLEALKRLLLLFAVLPGKLEMKCVDIEGL